LEKIAGQIRNKRVFLSIKYEIQKNKDLFLNSV
jgi:hypothetical protein